MMHHVSENSDTESPVHLLSLGCGGLLQDWIFIGRLVDAGFT